MIYSLRQIESVQVEADNTRGIGVAPDGNWVLFDVAVARLINSATGKQIAESSQPFQSHGVSEIAVGALVEVDGEQVLSATCGDKMCSSWIDWDAPAFTWAGVASLPGIATAMTASSSRRLMYFAIDDQIVALRSKLETGPPWFDLSPVMEVQFPTPIKDIVGIAVDPARDVVWICAGPGDPGVNSIWRFDLHTRNLKRMIVNKPGMKAGGLAFDGTLLWNAGDRVLRFEVDVEVVAENKPPAYEPEPCVVKYARQLAQLLPPGRLWNLEPESFLSRVLLAIAGEFARVDERCGRMIDEWDPRTAVETLPDWERVLGIVPHSDASVSERQIACANAYVARGGQTAAYLCDVAARLGFVTTITVTAPSTWRMDVDLAASSALYTLRTTEFRAGSSRAGDRLESRNVAELEDEINRIKPAHTVALFAYT